MHSTRDRMSERDRFVDRERHGDSALINLPVTSEHDVFSIEPAATEQEKRGRNLKIRCRTPTHTCMGRRSQTP